MPEARRHHFISQFYLKNFAADRRRARLFVVDLPGQKTFTASPSNVALENDFHTITTPGQETDAVEKQLSKFEAAVAPALARIIANGSLGGGEDAQLVLFFATLLLVKGPSTRSTINEFVNTLMSKIGKIEASDSKMWEGKIRRSIAEGTLPEDTDVEELRQLILSGSFTIGLSPEAHLKTEFENAQPLFERYVLTRRWNILKATSGQFVTCDRPVVLMWADPMKTDPVGLALTNTRILFALSSEIAICGGFELEDGTIEVGVEDVAKINGRIILNAGRQVYARDATFEYLLQHNPGIKQGSDLVDDEFTKMKAAR